MLKKKLFKAIAYIAVGLSCVLNTGCVAVSEKSEEISKEYIVCQEPRPEICTQQYDPVCGYLADGTQKTYGNGCTACSDQKVTKYKLGACPE